MCLPEGIVFTILATDKPGLDGSVCMKVVLFVLLICIRVENNVDPKIVKYMTVCNYFTVVLVHV